MSDTPEIRSEFKQIDPQEAARILSQNQYERHRRILPRHVSYLAEEMRRGNFQPTATIVFAEDDRGGLRLMNGQHVLSAIVESGAVVGLPVSVLQAKTDEDIADIYSAIDRHIRR